MKWLMLILMAAGAQVATADGAVHDAFKNGTTKGALRFYRNDQNYSSKQDTGTTSAGGSLHYETESGHFLKGGFTFYSANNMGVNSDDSTKVNALLPAANIDILGEAYLQLSCHDTTLMAGRQLFNSPFANASDAFMIPVTYEGYSLTNKSLAHTSITLAQLNQIKNRQSSSFVNTGLFATQRLLGTSQGQETAGTTVLDVNWADSGWMAELSGYHLPDLFDMEYVQAGYEFKNLEPVTPYIQTQYVNQSGTGDKILGAVSSQLYGAKLGAKWNRVDLSIAYTSSPTATNKWKNGGILGPYTFFTEPVFTNSMLSGPENNEAGNAYKAMLLWTPIDHFNVKLSYSAFDFKNYKHTAGGVNLSETDLWLAYAFGGAWQGFSAELRMAKVDADQNASDVTEYRSQLQYVF